jgi:hypothetical protein
MMLDEISMYWFVSGFPLGFARAFQRLWIDAYGAAFNIWKAVMRVRVMDLFLLLRFGFHLHEVLNASRMVA